MIHSLKCQYALRALFELASRENEEVVSVGTIAREQAIPARFLEQILAQLKQGGYVASRRGIQGGYSLAVSAGALTVGQVVRFFEGPLSPVKGENAGEGGPDAPPQPRRGRRAFADLWRRVQEAVEEVYDGTTFKDLAAQEPLPASTVTEYSI
jgi:Rrf2 family transcriptional regulator, cysteine metabolism repressor